MSETDLNALIRQAELQQQQMKLELQFQKNMALFKEFAKPIYDRYRNYTPTELALNLDEDGHVNLVNLDSGRPVYRKNPQEFCQEQVTAYRKSPRRLRIKYNPPKETYFFQLPLIRRLLDHFEDDFEKMRPSLKKPVGMMIINGCGLGYHINDLISSADIYTLCIFDSHRDSFYASLHTIDWEPIINYFYRPGRLLKLFIGNTDEETITSLRLLTEKIGLHNISNTFVFTHLNSPKADQFTNTLIKQYHLTLTGTGFFEDEQVSIAHTVNNINAGTPVLKRAKPIKDLPPAIIVGNGPSLDGLLSVLKNSLDDAVIFSCGSTTATLYRLGITPDFHVEMERIGGTTARLRDSLSAEFMNRLSILGLNTVAPATMALFGSAYMAKKINDPGEYIIDREFGDSFPPLTLCNPTCTNAGLAYALFMGFKEIYLFGTDLGMKNKDKHHSSSSQYYDKDSGLNKTEDKMVNIVRPGNLGGEVVTSAILDTSRANMELAIDLYQDGKLKVYNPNDGCRIQGAVPIRPDELSVSKGKKKPGTLEQITSHYFTKPRKAIPLTEKDIKRKYLEKFEEMKAGLKLPEEIANVTELQQRMDEIHRATYSLKSKAPVKYWLISGSVQSFFTLVMKSCLAADSRDRLAENYALSRNTYHEFLDMAFELIEEDCLKNHDMTADFSHIS